MEKHNKFPDYELKPEVKERKGC